MAKVRKMKMCAAKAERTFQDGFEEYVLDMKARNLRIGTIKHYQDSVKQLYKCFPQDMPITNFNSQSMPAFILFMTENTSVNQVSLGTYARDLKTLLRFFMRCEYIPHFEIKIPKADKEPVETFTDEELRALLKKPNVRKCSFTEYRTWVIVNFLLSTGMRQNSLINIRIQDVDFDNSMVYVNVTKNRKPLKLECYIVKSKIKQFMFAVAISNGHTAEFNMLINWVAVGDAAEYMVDVPLEELYPEFLDNNDIFPTITPCEYA